ncbi:unnamed protein product, partial [Didymodactylos carnosus]
QQKLIVKNDIERRITAKNEQVRLDPSLLSREKQNILERIRNGTKEEQRSRKYQLLKLGLAWDNVEVAKELIIEGSLDNIIHQKKVFIRTVKENLFTFVHYFIKIGVSVDKIFFSHLLTSNKGGSRYQKLLDELYTPELINREDYLLKYIILSDDFLKETKIDSIEILNYVLTKLIGDYMKHLYFETATDEQEAKRTTKHNQISDQEATVGN